MNPMQKDGASVIIQINSDPDTYEVRMTNGDIYTVEEDECSCGHTRDYTPSPSASLTQSYHKRRQASCNHQVAVLNAKELGSCPNCGEYQVRERKMRHHKRHVMSKYKCTNCGETLVEE